MNLNYSVRIVKKDGCGTEIETTIARFTCFGACEIYINASKGNFIEYRIYNRKKFQRSFTC